MIFIVEDNVEIREMEIYALQSSGFKVMAFDCGKAMEESLKFSEKPDLIVLDIMLPGEDGLSILKRLRAQDCFKNIPIMMLTAKSGELDKVKGLDSGADDYMTKPFGVLEFISRIKALLRRTSKNESSTNVLKLGNVILDDGRHIVTVDETPCELSFKEYELLKMLIGHPGHVYSRREILERVWGVYEKTDSIIETRTVDVHIKTLRQKLGTGGSIIHTIRNVGYKGDV